MLIERHLFSTNAGMLPSRCGGRYSVITGYYWSKTLWSCHAIVNMNKKTVRCCVCSIVSVFKSGVVWSLWLFCKVFWILGCLIDESYRCLVLCELIRRCNIRLFFIRNVRNVDTYFFYCTTILSICKIFVAIQYTYSIYYSIFTDKTYIQWSLSFTTKMSCSLQRLIQSKNRWVQWVNKIVFQCFIWIDSSRIGGVTNLTHYKLFLLQCINVNCNQYLSISPSIVMNTSFHYSNEFEINGIY